MERIVREGSKQCDDRKDPVRDNAKSPRDRKQIAAASQGSATHTLGRERGEAVSRRLRILDVHAPHWASIQEWGDCVVVNCAEGFGAI
ncbi:hypothetical protein NW765_004532 [Fusarium oxysporum]|nr:hypothetical protein NW765_004532 [Fusarium oxysporum]